MVNTGSKHLRENKKKLSDINVTRIREMIIK